MTATPRKTDASVAVCRAVVWLLCIDGGITEPAILAAAALHDTIEDAEATEEELATMFGDEIASLVLEMTDDKLLPKVERKRFQIEHAQHLRREAALVKLADKICNLRDVAANPPTEWSLERRMEIFRVGKGGD